MRRIRSTTSYSNYKNKNKIHKMKYVKDIIQDLKHYGPAGLIHITALSNIVERPIRIWNANGSLNKIIGRRKLGQPIDIEYHATDSEQIGHWTLRGGKDPNNVIIDLNSCLFSVIASQIGQNPLRLRRWTVLKLKNNFEKLAEWSDKIFLQLEGNKGISLMIGGARYIVSNAARIMTISEGKMGQGTKGVGHSITRHVETPVCRYTRAYPTEVKTAFRSRKDQNYVANLALKSDLVQKAINSLNEGAIECTVLITEKNILNDDLPMARKWKNGRAISNSRSIKMVRLTLRHQRNQFTNKDADVLVHTFYPIITEWTELPDWAEWWPPVSTIYRPSAREPDTLVISQKSPHRHYGKHEGRQIEEVLGEEIGQQVQEKKVEQQVQEKEVEQQVQEKEVEQQVQKKEVEQQVQEKEVEQQVQEKEVEQQVQEKEVEQQVQEKEVEQQVQEKKVEQQNL